MAAQQPRDGEDVTVPPWIEWDIDGRIAAVRAARLSLRSQGLRSDLTLEAVEEALNWAIKAYRGHIGRTFAGGEPK